MVRSALERLLLFARQDIERVRDELAKLEPDMTHAALEVALALPAMFIGEKFEIIGPADMQNGQHDALLLFLVSRTGCGRLQCYAVCLVDLQMWQPTKRRLVVGAD